MRFHQQTNERLRLSEKPLSFTVYRAESVLAKAVGAMGRRGLPADTALVFQFDRSRQRPVHMLGVRAPLRVWWVCDGVIERTERLPAWTGVGTAAADTVIELPADAPSGAVGQRVTVVDG